MLRKLNRGGYACEPFNSSAHTCLHDLLYSRLNGRCPCGCIISPEGSHFQLYRDTHRFQEKTAWKTDVARGREVPSKGKNFDGYKKNTCPNTQIL
ncbi:hypothetical protein YC2023_030202 [Brassica napus]